MKHLYVDGLPRPKSPLCHAVEANGFLFVSGQTPLDPATGTMPTGFDAQARQCLRNVRTILEAAGSSVDRVVKVTAYLRNLSDFPAFNAAYREAFPNKVPARTTVGVSLAGFDVEVDCIALAGGAND